MKPTLSTLPLALATASTLTLASLGQAQEGEFADTLEEITVLAQKRAQSLQEVPIAVTAVTGETIENSFATDLSDIGFLAPNVQLQAVSTFPGFANFTIRGIGVSTSIRTLDPAVNIIQDGMVLSTQIGAVLDVFDVEAIEILRGPQGILFGRNSTGGAVLLRTARPGEEFRAEGKIAVGTAELRQVEAILQGPLGDSGVRAKLAIQHRHQEGLFEDKNGGSFVAAPSNPSGLQPANPRTDQAGQDSILIKPTITFEPTDNLDITLFGQYFKDEGGGTASRMFVDPAAPSATETQFGYTPPSDPYEINHDLIGESDTRSWHTIVEANLDLGHGVVTSVTGYRDLTFDSSLDVDGTPFLLIHFPDNEEAAEQFTQELRYAADFSEQFDFLAGAFFMDSEMSVTERRMFSGLTAGRAHELYNFIQADWTQQQQSTAVFANVNYHLTPALTVSAGLRYTDEEKELRISPLAACAGPGFSGCSTSVLKLEDSWSNVSPRAGVEYRVSEDLLTYLTWSRGFRSGNFNARAGSLATIAAADPERADQFELGLKGEFFGRTLRTNIAAFATTYDDIQRVTNTVDSNGQPLQRLRNAADATITGLELEAVWTPTARLSFDASLGWIDAEFDEFTGLDLDNDGTVTAAEEREAEGLDFDRVPKYTAALAANIGFVVDALPGEFTFRTQWAYRDSFPTDVRNLEILEQDAYDILDISLRYETDQLRIALFGRNVRDEEYTDIKSRALNLQAFGGQPRAYGFEVGYMF